MLNHVWCMMKSARNACALLQFYFSTLFFKYPVYFQNKSGPSRKYINYTYLNHFKLQIYPVCFKFVHISGYKTKEYLGTFIETFLTIRSISSIDIKTKKGFEVNFLLFDNYKSFLYFRSVRWCRMLRTRGVPAGWATQTRLSMWRYMPFGIQPRLRFRWENLF